MMDYEKQKALHADTMRHLNSAVRWVSVAIACGVVTVFLQVVLLVRTITGGP